MRRGSKAVAYALKLRAAGRAIWDHLCLKFVRTCLGVPPRYSSARVAWSHVAKSDRHGGSTPPPGVPVFWSPNHVALSVGGGYVESTDILREGLIDRVSIDYITRHWGLRYLGWTETLNGKRVYTAPAAPARVTVHVHNMVESARTDPHAAQGHAAHPNEGRLVEAALVREGLLDDRWASDGAFGTKTVHAYARWQRRCGYSGAGADGIPGASSLGALGKRYGFEVAA